MSGDYTTESPFSDMSDSDIWVVVGISLIIVVPILICRYCFLRVSCFLFVHEGSF